MKLSFDIARRYLFGKKSTNAINVISWISVSGVAIGTAALILILSVFNGFEGLISGLFNAFNPDLMITAKEGKVFEDDQEIYDALLQVEGVLSISKTIQEIVLLKYDEVDDFGIIKGVDQYFKEVTNIDSTLRKGKFILEEKGVNYGVAGIGLANKLGLSVEDGYTPMVVYVPRLKATGPMAQGYGSAVLYPAGTFSVQTEQDVQTIISSLSFVQNLRQSKTTIGAYELKLDPNIKEQKIRTDIQEIVGESFAIKNRFEQDEAFLKLMNIEKWVSYALAGFAFVLIAFNLVGCLWMIVLDKKKDISILRTMGYTPDNIQVLFIIEGLFICIFGIIIGLFFAIVFYALQKSFGIISIPEGFIIDAYPMEMRLTDVLIVTGTVLTIGFLASVPGSIRAKAIKAFVREE